MEQSKVSIASLLRYGNNHINKLRFSLFYDEQKGMFATIPNGEIPFIRLVEIYTSDFVRVRTEMIRNEQDEKVKKELKKKLPFITPYSVFTGSRKNINQSYFNENLLALDIDGLKPDDVHLVKMILTQNKGTILCAVSPRGKGIKAFILINDTIPKENAYNVLKLNLNHIAEGLGLSDFVNKIDLAQFKPTQPWFISFDNDLYVNVKPQPFYLNLITVIESTYLDTPTDFEFLPKADQDKYKMPCSRIDTYINNAVATLEKFFALCVDGNRHRNIIKVQGIASIIHYAQHLEDEVKKRLLNACMQMYGSEAEAKENNVPNSFNKAWNGAKPKPNNTIEGIILEEGY